MIEVIKQLVELKKLKIRKKIWIHESNNPLPLIVTLKSREIWFLCKHMECSAVWSIVIILQSQCLNLLSTFYETSLPFHSYSILPSIKILVFNSSKFPSCYFNLILKHKKGFVHLFYLSFRAKKVLFHLNVHILLIIITRKLSQLSYFCTQDYVSKIRILIF